MFSSCGNTRDFLFITDFYGIIGIQILDNPIPDIYARDAISRCGHDITFIKTDIPGIRRNGFVPVDFSIAQPQMPFSNSTCFIPCLLQHRRQGHSPVCRWNNERSVTRKNMDSLSSPRVLPRHHSITGRGTNGCRTVGIGKSHSLFRQFIDMGCRDFCCSITPRIAVSQIIRIKINDCLGAWNILIFSCQ